MSRPAYIQESLDRYTDRIHSHDSLSGRYLILHVHTSLSRVRRLVLRRRALHFEAQHNTRKPAIQCISGQDATSSAPSLDQKPHQVTRQLEQSSSGGSGNQGHRAQANVVTFGRTVLSKELAERRFGFGSVSGAASLSRSGLNFYQNRILELGSDTSFQERLLKLRSS